MLAARFGAAFENIIDETCGVYIYDNYPAVVAGVG